MNDAILTKDKRSSADCGCSIHCFVSILQTLDNKLIGPVHQSPEESRLAASDSNTRVCDWQEAKVLEMESLKHPDGSHYVRVTQIAFRKFMFLPPNQSVHESDASIKVRVTT